jgi:hypothetical protein
MVVMAIGLLAGCDDTMLSTGANTAIIVDGEGFEAVSQVIRGRCLESCHSAGGLFPDLETDPCAATVEAASQSYSGVLVAPSAPSDSVLWHKITDSGEFGGIMPAGASEPIASENIDIITDWIADGASCSDPEVGDDSDDVGPPPDTGDPDAATTRFSDLYEPVFSQCLDGCHSTDYAMGDLLLEPEQTAFAQLTTGDSDGLPYVDTTSPRESFLYLKLSADNRAGYGMPDADGATPLERDQVLRWIRQGAGR